MSKKTESSSNEFNQFSSDWSDPEQVWEEIRESKSENSEKQAETGAPYKAPGTPTEVAVARIWSTFLGIDKIGIHDGFTKLGGHSLMVMEILARVQEEFDVQIPMATFFSETDFTVAELAKIIDEYQINQVEGVELESLLDEVDQLSDEEIKELLENEM